MSTFSLVFFLNWGFLVVQSAQAGKSTDQQRQNPGTQRAGGPFRTTPETGSSQGDIHGNVPGSPGKSCQHASSQGKKHGEPDDCLTPTPTPKPHPTVTPTPTPTPTPEVLASQPTPTPTSKPNELPECLGLSAFPTLGGAVLTANLTGSGSDRDGKIMAFEFNFGDGQKKTVEIDVGGSGSQTLSHSYALPGTYQASLRVRDNNGQWSKGEESCQVKIQVEGEILAAQAPSVQPKTGGSLFLTLGFLGAGLAGAAIKRFLI